MKKLLYVTGSRAEYGIMKRLLLKLNQDSEIDLKIVATAMQVDERYGMTYKVIEEDGLNIDKLINIQLDNSNNEKVIHSMAICLDKFGKYLYNRCHLIGYQLSGENDNELNLITGTRYLNTEGMLPFENLVAEYIKANEVIISDYKCDYLGLLTD